MPGLFIEEGSVEYVEVTQALSELFFVGIRERTNECKQYFPCFRLGFECRAAYDDTLHVKVTHLERNAAKHRDISTKAVAGHGEDNVS